MKKKRPRRLFLGHKRNLVPLSAIKYARQSPKLGWRVECICGWAMAPFHRRADGEIEYRMHVESALPICGSCKTTKHPSAMSKASPHRCKKCVRIAHKAWIVANPSRYERARRRSLLKKKYGITPEQFDEMVENQAGVCAICAGPLEDSRGFRPHVDHSHKTGKVRGILCGRCNHGIGHFRDDPAIIIAALAYLNLHQGENS